MTTNQQLPTNEALQQELGRLFSDSLSINIPIQSLHTIRERMQADGYKQFDKEEILVEIGHLQGILIKLYHALINIHELIKK